MIFRKPCTWIIIGFVLFNLCFIKKLKHTRLAILLGLVIASPLLLEILLFWNNDSFGEGLKSMEKSISLLLFPVFILGNYKRVQFIKLLQFYSYTTTVIVLFFFIRFIVVYPDLIDKYLGGTDLWEMGYSFSNSIGIHAPALNMHLAFVAIISMYFVVYSFRKNENVAYKLLRILVLALSFFFVLFVNTRMALFNVIAGTIIIFFYEVIRYYNFKKVAGGGGFFMKEKYSTVTFAYMDKVGKLDEIENPEAKVFNSFVTRVSIWKSAWELSLDHLPFGVGASDGKPELFKYYKQTNQHFLAKYEFPTHNQFLDFLLKFGVLGPMVVFIYIFTIGYLGYDLKNAIILSFFILFLTSNLTDDFLLRFDGIAFSGFWFSVFGSFWLQEKATACKERLIA